MFFIIKAFNLLILSFFEPEVILETVDISAELVSVFTPLFFSFRCSLCLDFKLIALDFDLCELFSKFIQLNVDLVCSSILISKLISLSLH